MFENSELFNRVQRFISVPYSRNDREAKAEEIHDAIHKDRSVSIDGDNAAWSGSDYSGNTYYKSNARSLYRDHHALLTENSYAYDGYGLKIIAKAFFSPANREAAEDLLGTLESLADDYPVYDEQDHSELEEELAHEGWEGWLRSDLASEIETKSGITVDLSGDDAYGEIMTVFSERSIYAESDGPSDVTWRGWGDTLTLTDVINWALDNDKATADLEDITPYGWTVLTSYTYRPIDGQMILEGVVVR